MVSRGQEGEKNARNDGKNEKHASSRTGSKQTVSIDGLDGLVLTRQGLFTHIISHSFSARSSLAAAQQEASLRVPSTNKHIFSHYVRTVRKLPARFQGVNGLRTL